MTKRDKEVLEYIKEYMTTHGTVPTIREICKGLGLYSTSSAHAHFQKLIKEGEIIPVADNSYRYRVKGMRYIEDANKDGEG